MKLFTLFFLIVHAKTKIETQPNKIKLIYNGEANYFNEIIDLILPKAEYQLNLTLTNESDGPFTLDIDDDKYSHLYLQTQIKSHKNRKPRIEPNESLRVTFAVYCPTSNASPERNVNFFINDKSYPITVNRDCTETESNVAVCTVAIVLSILSILIAIIAVLIYLFIQKQHYSRSPSKSSQLPQNEDEQCLLKDENFGVQTISRKSIRLLKTIQEGKLGVIYQAEMIKGKRSCLIKAVTKNSEEIDPANEKSMYLNLEGALLRDSRQLMGLKHKHICSLIGQIVDDGGDVMAIFPWIETGNLKLFLRRCQLRTPTSRPSAKSSVSTFDLISIAQQAADSLAYLDEQRIIHGDIASRNCQLGLHNHFYLCDSALSTDLFPADYETVHYNGQEYKVPIRWSPPERLDIPTQISLKGDIWSFGMFLWELLSLAREPYSDIEPDRIHSFLQNGYRAVKPLGCPDELYELMTACWQYQLEQRPKTRDLFSRLETIKHNHIL